MEELFGQPGNRIRKWAVGAFIIECIGLLVAFFVLLIEEDFFVALAAVLVGFVVVYGSCLLLFAFGTLVQSNEENAQTNREILAYLRKDQMEEPKPAKPLVEFAEVPKQPVNATSRKQSVKPMVPNADFAKAIKGALSYQSEDKMRAQLARILLNRDLSQYHAEITDILEEVPRDEQRQAVENLLKRMGMK